MTVLPEPHRTRVAYHEAGHAVLMMALGVELESASIIPDERSAGRVEVPRGGSVFKLDDSESPAVELARLDQVEILWAMAGPVAQGIVGFSDTPTGDDALSIDAAAHRAELLLGNYTASWVNRLRQETEAYLRRNWSAVERIAAALLQDGEVDGSRLRELAGPLERPDLMSALKHSMFFASRARRTNQEREESASMDKYEVLDGFRVTEALGDVYPGEVIELSPEDAAVGLRLGRLRLVGDKPTKRRVE